MTVSSRRIAAVTVTFNRKEMLLECIDALLKQTVPLEKIIVIDNASTDGTMHALKFAGFLSDRRIDVTNLRANRGGAGGFHAGILQAYQEGYDWVWVMDDDALPNSNTLGVLLESIEAIGLGAEIPIAICPRVINQITGKPESHQHKVLTRFFFEKNAVVQGNGLIPIDANAFVGPLINRASIENCGLPVEKYFIWVDDLDYTYRIAQKGHLVLDPSAVIFHRDTSPGRPHPRRRFFGQRNFAYFLRRTVPEFAKDRRRLRLRIAASLAVHLCQSLLYSQQYLRMMKYSFAECLLPVYGFICGLVNRFDNPS